MAQRPPETDACHRFARGLVPPRRGREHALAAMHLLKLWFGFTLPVSRRAYALSGFGLMAVKYAIEALAVAYFTGGFYSPLVFFSPLLSHKEDHLRRMMDGAHTPIWLLTGAICLSLPFLWVALSMSIRRAVDAGRSAAWGLLILVPFANFGAMLWLASRPSDPEGAWNISAPRATSAPGLRSALLGIAAGLGIALVTAPLAIYGGNFYGLSVFVATPFLMSACAAFVLNRPTPGGLGASLAVAQLAVLLTSLALVLFAMEGVLCIAMALPIASVMALLGGLVGHAFAVRSFLRGANLFLALLALPFLTAAESWRPPPPLREVVSVVEIDASPEVVWPHVIGFSRLTEPPPWYFRAGIAYPQYAEIHGEGVGAVRHCVFSTGPFVEPITVWDPPHRLAFDVTSQPRPMRELSPWGDIAAPHLEDSLVSRRGEFRLIELPDGRTRLEGSTWYTLDMYPQAYWTLWSDGLIHGIHGQVLEHIAHLAEAADG